jgi:uncharacterized damage-inducible protein DinB
MTWTAPDVTRIDEPFAGDERATLDGFLDWYRGTLLLKCAGLSAEQLAARSVPPSNLSLLGMVRHMTEVERSWFRRRFAGEDVERVYNSDERPDADLDDVIPDSAEEAFAAYAGELERCRAAVADHALAETFTNPRLGVPMSLRWVYVHMIEEYARHCGHADLIRERIDGAVGS